MFMFLTDALFIKAIYKNAQIVLIASVSEQVAD